MKCYIFRLNLQGDVFSHKNTPGFLIVSCSSVRVKYSQDTYMQFLLLNLQLRVKSHKHSTYLLGLVVILEAGVYYEHYGKFCTALYGSAQLRTARYNSVWQVMHCTRFFLYMIYSSHHNFLWSKYLSSMK